MISSAVNSPAVTSGATEPTTAITAPQYRIAAYFTARRLPSQAGLLFLEVARSGAGGLPAFFTRLRLFPPHILPHQGGFRHYMPLHRPFQILARCSGMQRQR